VHEHTDTQRATSLLVPACQVQLAVRPRGRFPPCFALLSAMLPTAAPERGLLSPRGGARGRSAKKVRAGDRVCKAGPCCRCCTPCRRAPPAALTLASAARAEPARVARHVAGGARERRRRRRRRSFGVPGIVLRAPAGRVHAPVQRRARHHRHRRHRAAATRAGCVRRARPCRSSPPACRHMFSRAARPRSLRCLRARLRGRHGARRARVGAQRRRHAAQVALQVAAAERLHRRAAQPGPPRAQPRGSGGSRSTGALAFAAALRFLPHCAASACSR